MGAFLHRYYCWMDQVRGIGRITKLRLLRSAEERDLFSAELTDAPTGRAGAERIYRASEEELRFLCGEACTFQADAERTAQILKRAQRQVTSGRRISAISAWRRKDSPKDCAGSLIRPSVSTAGEACRMKMICSMPPQ